MVLSKKLQQKIGYITPPTLLEIEKNQIRRFALSIGEENPIHMDELVAKKAGFRSIVAPITFPLTLIKTNFVEEELDIHSSSMMHREEEYEYYSHICAGDIVSIVYKIANIYKESIPNGSIIFFVIEIQATGKRKSKIFSGQRTMLEIKN